LRDLLVESDAALDPQAWVLRPDVVLRLSAEIMREPTPYRRTRRALLAALTELRAAHDSTALKIAPREIRWLDTLQHQADALPESEDELTADMFPTLASANVRPEEYGLQP
jgi:methanol--5-hydroxybenzimidazolylcobamide Co-methyltransferase